MKKRQWKILHIDRKNIKKENMISLKTNDLIRRDKKDSREIIWLETKKTC